MKVMAQQLVEAWVWLARARQQELSVLAVAIQARLLGGQARLPDGQAKKPETAIEELIQNLLLLVNLKEGDLLPYKLTIEKLFFHG